VAQKRNSQRSEVSEQQREARRILNRVEREAEQVGTSSMARTANKVRDHFLGEEKHQDDKIEIMGKRIGRGLAILVFVILAFTLVSNYILPQ